MDKGFIVNIIKSFANEERIFQKEAQFQFDLAWRLREELGDKAENVLLEYRISEKKEYTDIVVNTDEGLIAFELKYRLSDKAIKYISQDNKVITTSAQGAPDTGCYGFLRDIEKLKKNKDAGRIAQGFAIIMTNYPLIWGSGIKEKTNWEQMCLKDNREIRSGKIQWRKLKTGEEYGKEIEIKTDYKIEWENYTMETMDEVQKRPGIEHPFRFLIVEV